MFHSQTKVLRETRKTNRIKIRNCKRRALAGLFPPPAALALRLLAAVLCLPASPARAFTTNQNASVVIGQPDMTSSGGGATANTLNAPWDVCSMGTKLFVVDSWNNRVLIYNTIPASNNANADVVVGQPDMTSGTNNNGGIGPNTLSTPTGVYSDGTKLFVADQANQRVLIYNTIPTSNNASADVVIGQPNMTSNTANNGGIGPNTLRDPTGVYSDGTKLFVTDKTNSRVLIYNTIPTSNNANADVVIGQPDMTSVLVGTTANRFGDPTGISSDGTKLFVADYGNNRVLIYNTIPTSNNASADVVVGQPDMTSGGVNQGGSAAANTLSENSGISSGGTKLFVSDYGNNRVLIYNTIPASNNASADVVIGQPDMTSAGYNQGGSAAANTLSVTFGVSSDGTKFFVADTDNNRVLIYDPDTTPPTVTDNQAGDNSWRVADPGAIYDVDFADAGGSNLNNVQYAVYSAAALGGSQLKAWTDITTGINANSYTTNWGVDWASLQNGTNYVSVRAYDNDGNPSDVATDAFYIKKDPSIPTVTDNHAGDNTWRIADPGAIFDVDFADTGGSDLNNVQYAVYSAAALGGAQLKAWTDIATGINAANYATNWGVDWASLQNGTNYVSVRAYDNAGNVSAVSQDAFYIKKDTAVPTITDNQAGDDTMRTADPGAIFDVDFTDTGGSNLNNAQYAVYSAAALGGSQLKAWTDIATGINAANYATNWGVDWASLQNGTNYVSVRAYDNAGNVSAVSQDVFYVKKSAADTTPPTQSAWNPANNATINTTSKNITLTLNENGDCKWSLTDQAYGDMSNACTGGGSTSITCAVTGLTDGARTVSIACQDTVPNADTAGTNTDLSYTVNTALPDTTPPAQSAWNPANNATITTASKNITLTLDETGDCKWSLTDQAYGDMSNACTGGGTTSITCAVIGLTDGARTVSIACKDTLNNADTAGTNTDLSYTVNTGGGGPAPDTTPPTLSGFSPASGETIKTSSPEITFTTSENADSKWSLTDQAYADMAGDCTGDGTTAQTCAVSGLSEGAVTIYIASRDDTGNADTAQTNTALSYTYQKASYDSGLQYQFIYLCPPVTVAQAAQLGAVRKLVNGQYQTIDATQPGECGGYVTSTNAQISVKADVPNTAVTVTLTVGWNLIFNPFDAALAYNSDHFSFKKTGGTEFASLDDSLDLPDYVVLGPGYGKRKVVPDDVAAIPALTAFMLYSKAAGELMITP